MAWSNRQAEFKTTTQSSLQQKFENCSMLEKESLKIASSQKLKL